MSSAYVICWIFLQTFQTYFCIQANSVDPDQTENQTDLDPHCLQKWLFKSQADDKADDNVVIGSLRVKGMDILSGETTFFKLFLPPFWKGIYSKRKKFAPSGSTFFPFRVDPF